MKKVSIIVPIYNTEKYLSKCIESLINQTYHNIEIILVNDGSNDGTEKVCKKYKKKDSRVKYFYKKNGGVSSARNLGLIKSTGDYIAFVDSDDYVSESYIFDMVNIIDGYDMVLTSMDHNTNKIKSRELTKNEILYCLFNNEEIGYQGYACSKLFIKKYIEKYNISFDEKITHNEDRLFVFNYLLNVKKVYYIDKNYYYYRKCPESAMAIREYNKKTKTEFEAFKIMIKEAKEKELPIRIISSIDIQTINRIAYMSKLYKSKELSKQFNLFDLLKRLVSYKYSFMQKIKLIKYYIVKY